MQTGISVIHVTQATPTSTGHVSPVFEMAAVLLFADIIERVTPPTEFRPEWKSRNLFQDHMQQPAAKAHRAAPMPPERNAVASGGPVDDAAADTRQQAPDNAASSVLGLA